MPEPEQRGEQGIMNTLVPDCCCVLRGTRVVCLANPSPALPASGEGASSTHSGEGASSTDDLRTSMSLRSAKLPASVEGANVPSALSAGATNLPPLAGGLEGGSDRQTIIPIERIQPGNYIFAHDGIPHRVLGIFSRIYTGQMIGLSHNQAATTLWLTANHLVLAKLRPRTLGGNGGWSAVPIINFERSRELRRNQTPAEQRLWAKLRGEQLGYKFRRQHPIGPYIADFYSRDACLVVEVDGDTHSSFDAQVYDAQRDHDMRSLGLCVLRFSNTDVYQNLDGVVAAIEQHCTSIEQAAWIQANQLQPGDTVFFGVERKAVHITVVERQTVTREEIYSLQVEYVDSYITDVCVVHCF